MMGNVWDWRRRKTNVAMGRDRACAGFGAQPLYVQQRNLPTEAVASSKSLSWHEDISAHLDRDSEIAERCRAT